MGVWLLREGTRAGTCGQNYVRETAMLNVDSTRPEADISWGGDERSETPRKCRQKTQISSKDRCLKVGGGVRFAHPPLTRSAKLLAKQ